MNGSLTVIIDEKGYYYNEKCFTWEHNFSYFSGEQPLNYEPIVQKHTIL